MKLFFYTFLAVFLAAIQTSAAAESSGEILTNAEQVRALSVSAASQHLPTKLRGVVTGEGRTGVVIQDSTAGIFLYSGTNNYSWLKRGDLVEVEGTTDPGQFAPVVWPQRISKVGTGQIPAPRQASLDALESGAVDAQWVQVSGIVRECRMVQNYEFKMILAIGGMRLPVQYFGPTNALGLVDAEVRLTGICFYQFSSSRQILNPLLMVPGDKYLVVEKPAPASPFTAPLRRAQNILEFTPEDTRRHRVCVRGAVLYQIPGETLWLRNNGHGLRVNSPKTQPLKPGDTIDVAGFPANGDFTPVLEDATFRVIAPATNNPEPIAVTRKSDALERDGDLIQLTAQLADITRTLNGWLFTVNWQGNSLRASLRQAETIPDNLEPGSRVRLTGICRATADNASFIGGGGPQQAREFQLLLRSPEDVVVLQRLPWWTTKRILILLTTVTGISLLVSAGIALMARQRLREQELRRAMAETEFSAMFAERNRIARELHDTLAQGLGAISMHLELVKDRLGYEPEKVTKHLDIAHQMARQSLTEARNSIWNMRSHILENTDLASALQGILAQLTSGTTLESHFLVTGPARRLATAIENNLLRIGQESITNAVKHARAKKISVALDFSAGDVCLTVRDDGSGFNPAQPPAGSHFGLLGQRERTAQMGGKLEVNSAPGQGTEVKVRIPIYD